MNFQQQQIDSLMLKRQQALDALAVVARDRDRLLGQLQTANATIDMLREQLRLYLSKHQSVTLKSETDAQLIDDMRDMLTIARRIASHLIFDSQSTRAPAP